MQSSLVGLLLWEQSTPVQIRASPCYAKIGLNTQVWNKLIEFKDECWVDGNLDIKMLEEYLRKVEQFKNNGYNVRVHELVVEQLYRRLERTKSEYL